MNSVDKIVGLEALSYRGVIGCPHIYFMPNPLCSDVLNVGVSASASYVLVVEEGKIKLVCWTCLRKIFGVPTL